MHACMCSRDVLYVDMSMNAQVHIRERICKCICICIRSRTRSQICSRLHISVALPAHTVVSYYSPRQATNGGGRAAGGQARTSSGPVRRAGSWNLTRACGQHQTTATKAYNWANAISWSLHWTLVWCHLSLLGNWQADQFTCCQKSEKRLTAFRETAPRKAIENTVQYHNDGVASVVANHHGGSGNSMA